MTLSSRKLSRSNGGSIVIMLFLLVLAAIMVLPLLYVVLQAFKPLEELFIFPPRFWVKSPTMENFRQLMNVTSNLWVPFSRYLFNSVFITLLCTVIQVVFASMAAYPLAKNEFVGKQFIFGMVVISLLFTYEVTFIPQYLILSSFRLINTFLSLICTAAAFPMGLYLMRQNLLLFPDSILESARIDGATEAVVFWKIIMPANKTVWMTMAMFSFNGMWNRSDSAYIYDEQLKSLPTLLSQIAAGGISRMGVGAATSLLLIIPPIIVFLLTQSRVMETMANSGMKD